MRRTLILVLLPLTLAACASTGLRDLRTNSSGPDEFRVAPVKPLEAPTDYNTLPAPTPGQANLTDRSAINEGIVAFGGRPEAAGGAIPARDGALVQHASRLGVTPGVRQKLAETDAQFRKRKARFTQFRIVPTDRYSQAYRREVLNAEVEAARWRRAGARTPSSPPRVR
ncbi:MAG: DUF3035 domain-containing protein [Sulfitobacter sp.]